MTMMYIIGRKMFEAEDYARKHSIPVHNWRYINVDDCDKLRGLRLEVVYMLANAPPSKRLLEFLLANNTKIVKLPE